MKTAKLPTSYKDSVELFIEHDVHNLLDKQWVYDTIHRIFKQPVRDEGGSISYFIIPIGKVEIESCAITTHDNGFEVKLDIIADTKYQWTEDEFLQHYENKIGKYIYFKYDRPDKMTDDGTFNGVVEITIDTTDYVLRNGIAYVMEHVLDDIKYYYSVSQDLSKQELTVSFNPEILLYKPKDDLYCEVQRKLDAILTDDEALIHNVHTGKCQIDMDTFDAYIEARCNLKQKATTADINSYFSNIDKTEIGKAITIAKLKNLM